MTHDSRLEKALIAKIHSATISVNDQDKALDFYVNVLGFEKALDNPMGPDMRFLSVVPKGAVTQLVIAHTSWGGPIATENTGVSFTTPDIAETYKTYSDRGVEFSGPPEDMPWGQKATWFSDPDGNRFFLVEEA